MIIHNFKPLSRLSPLVTAFFLLIPCYCFAQEYHGQCAPPGFSGGTGALHEYIKANLHYPAEALEKQISGVAVVEFVVTHEGLIQGVDVISGFDDQCDAEAERVVGLLKGWNPGVNWGTPVDSKIRIPIEFKIANNTVRMSTLFSGTVTEKCSGIPLGGILVRIMDTNIGTLTSSKGEFELEIPIDKCNLEFSSVDYENKVINIKNFRVMNIELDKMVYTVDFDSAVLK